MLRRITIVLPCIVVACLGLSSCRKVGPAQLRFQQLQTLDAIPADYGNLIGVTSDNNYPNWAQLWFEKADKSIVVVRVNWAEGIIFKNVTVIPRR